MPSPSAEATGKELDGFELLTNMVRIPSVSTQEHELGAWLLDYLPALGFRVSRDGAGNVIAERGAGPSEIMFLGHMDTVPGAIPVREEGGRLFGRGAVDAKGPLAAAITAVARHPVSRSHRTTIIAAVEEEGSSRGARHLVSRPAPDQLIVLEPSGWDAVTLGYKGSLAIRYRLSQSVAHGAGPTGSAADHAIAFIHRLQDHAASASRDRGIFDRVDVRVIEMHAAHDGLRDLASATIGMRLPLQFDIEALRAALEEWRGEAEIAIDHADAAVRAEKNTPLVRAFLAGIRSAGGTPRFKNKTGTSDMNIVLPLWKCPALAYGPGDSSLDHTPLEAIERDEFERGVAVLSAALTQLVPA
ncbi:MAG: [LysW]-lysine hydrolase [Candidatus Dormibacteraeota bacterium]|nr:[LysW]-lysine hydrolase [Candidatus Dormibacteraeota bacterium]